MRQYAAQHYFIVNTWASLIGNCLIGPYLLPSRMAIEKHWIFLEQVLPGLLDEVPMKIKRNMWFQHDGAPVHIGQSVRRYLNRSFRHRGIERDGPVPWPPRSSNLSCFVFFLYISLKAIESMNPVKSKMGPVARIDCSAAMINETSSMFDCVSSQ